MAQDYPKMQYDFATGKYLAPSDWRLIEDILKQQAEIKASGRPHIQTEKRPARPRGNPVEVTVHRIFSHGRAIAEFDDTGEWRLLMDIMDLMALGGFPKTLAQVILDKTTEGYRLGIDTSIKTLRRAGQHAAADLLAAQFGDVVQAPGDVSGSSEQDDDGSASGPTTPYWIAPPD